MCEISFTSKATIMYLWHQACLETTEMPSTPTLIHTVGEEMEILYFKGILLQVQNPFQSTET